MGFSRAVGEYGSIVAIAANIPFQDLIAPVLVFQRFVTHDQEEAMEVADEIVVMNEGRIEQIGTPATVYDHPATPFVMRFIGPVNVLPSTAPLFQRNGWVPAQPQVFVRPQDIHVQAFSDPTATTATVNLTP